MARSCPAERLAIEKVEKSTVSLAKNLENISQS
jgi:hypothetical protein